MKPWRERTKADKAKRIGLSVVLIGWIGYGSVAATRDIAEYVFVAPCRDGVMAALTEYQTRRTAIDRTGDVAFVYRQEAAALSGFYDDVAALYCPTAGDQKARFLTSLQALIELIEGFASGSSMNFMAEGQAYDQAGSDLMALRAAVGATSPTPRESE